MAQHHQSEWPHSFLQEEPAMWDVPYTPTVIFIIFFQNTELWYFIECRMRPHCFPFLVPSKTEVGWLHKRSKTRQGLQNPKWVTCFVVVGKSSGSHLDVPIVRIQVPPRSNWTCPGVRSGRCLCRGVEGYRKPSMTIITSGINYSNNTWFPVILFLLWHQSGTSWCKSYSEQK